MSSLLVLDVKNPDDNKSNLVKIKLRPDLAPKHVERIIELTKEGFYNGVVFHWVIENFVAQTGDPTGTGKCGSNKPDLENEFNSEPHVRGICSMARTSAPDSANSQFFICFDATRFLDRQYTVWGEVVEGMEFIDNLPKGEPPRNPGKIVSAEIVDEKDCEILTTLKVSLPKQSIDRLNEMSKTCEQSVADVLSNALRLFEHVITLQETGHSFQTTKDGETKPLKIFGR